MTKIELGVQSMTIKDKFAELGPYETIRQLAELGYKTLEVSQIPMTAETIREIKKASEDFGVEVAAISGNLVNPVNGEGDCLEDNLVVFIDQCQLLNCHYIRIGMLPVIFFENKQSIINFAERAEAVAKLLAKEGIKLCYHNHHHEFHKFDGQYILDIIFEHAPSIGLEFDVYWGQRGGVNPIEIIRQHPGRVDLIHLKDYKVEQLSASYFDQMRAGDYQAVHQAFSQNCHFAALGEGNLNLLAIIDVAVENGSKYFFVEQDETYGQDTMACLETSIGYLQDQGYLVSVN